MLNDKKEPNARDTSILTSGSGVGDGGVVAYGGDLEPKRLIEAYRMGIFPWYQEAPILWWSPDPRCVLFPDKFKASRSLRKSIRKYDYRFTFDQAFGEVIRRCARRDLNPDAVWIHNDMIDAYSKLHELGYAHSVETWMGQQLAGGLYGIALGRIFFGESMFSINTDASKAALAHLIEHLIGFNYVLIDCQITSNHLLSMGAEEIPRECFMRILEKNDTPPVPGCWSGTSKDAPKVL